ncbi:MAG: ATP-binding protein [Hyphomicrobiales bacterium]|nr:ATP-binding protein [Hyphomicrobiales bacterium]
MRKDWGFYGRNSELAEVGRIISSGRWFFCQITGRRRIGKTTLIRQALAAAPENQFFYFQVPDSDERGVVQAFWEAWEDSMTGPLDVLVPQTVRSFPDIVMMIEAMNGMGIIVIIDEFQYFHRKSLSAFTSFLQGAVDRLRDTGQGGLFVLGSIHTEMMAVLEDRGSPLFNRVTDRIALDHWDFETLFEMFAVHGSPTGTTSSFSGACSRGAEILPRRLRPGRAVPGRRLPAHDPAAPVLRGHQPLRDEATNWFLRELRGRYDSVLKILANKGPCPLSDLKAEYRRAGPGGEQQLGQYLTILIDRYAMVEKLQPVFAGSASRKARYAITDNFLSAWLRAVARNVQMARVQPVDRPSPAPTTCCAPTKDTVSRRWCAG